MFKIFIEKNLSDKLAEHDNSGSIRRFDDGSTFPNLLINLCQQLDRIYTLLIIIKIDSENSLFLDRPSTWM